MTRAADSRPRAEQLSLILGTPFKVLDDGFVRLVDYMGGDESIVQAARVSYGRGTKTVNEDRGLIRYLMRHMHTTPFEMVELKFHVKLPIFVARQWIRHRTANVNEYSGRYSIIPDRFYHPSPQNIRRQSASNRQGGDEPVDDLTAREFCTYLEKLEADYAQYEKFIARGVARELA